MNQAFEKIQVLSVVGRGRSGSTLLEHIASSHINAVAVGELRLISMLDLGSHQCSCGSPVKSCEVWSGVLARLDMRFSSVDTERLQLKRTMLRRYQLLCFLPWRSLFIRKLFARELVFLSALYSAVAEEFQTDTIIDSSKNTFYSLLLAESDNLQVSCVHLIRDPRAVWYSWKRQQRRSQEVHLYQRRIGILKHSFTWLGANFSAELVKSESKIAYFWIKYEDLVKNPKQVFNESISVLRLCKAQLGNREYHSLSGNPSRHTDSFSEIKPDDEWKKKISRFDRCLVSFLTFPLLRKYKY